MNVIISSITIFQHRIQIIRIVRFKWYSERQIEFRSAENIIVCRVYRLTSLSVRTKTECTNSRFVFPFFNLYFLPRRHRLRSRQCTSSSHTTFHPIRTICTRRKIVFMKTCSRYTYIYFYIHTTCTRVNKMHPSRVVK